LEEGTITVVRLHGAAKFPATFTLVASMNPCPCGHHGNPHGRCVCTPLQVCRYRAKLSGPLLDRFDLVVEVPPLDLDSLAHARCGEHSAAVRDRVVRARARQRGRFGRRGPTCNGRMGPSELRRFARPDGESRQLLRIASDRLGLTARGFDRVRRVALTLADLEGREGLAPADVAEALQYRHPEPVGRG
jgi:magnesium chelatase family protein